MKKNCSLAASLAAAIGISTAVVVATPQPVTAATITVAPGVVHVDGTDGRCSLIEALENANAGAATHTDCTSGSPGADSIVLSANSTYTLTNGLPTITSSMTILGNGATIARSTDAPGDFRLINVVSAQSVDLTIDRVTLTGGQNIGEPGLGGAIFTENPGTITITNSTISNNTARGGGAFYGTGTLNIVNSTFNGNSSIGGAGGAIVFFAATHGNALNITNSTFTGNSSAGAGAAVLVDLFPAVVPMVTIRHSTFADNTGTSTIQDYTADAEVTISNTIVSSPSIACALDPSSTLRNNLATDTTCGGAAYTAAQLGLGALADNGGPTRTHALLAGSFAINAATYTAPDVCPATDQRGVSRPRGTACDIGAFEHIPPAPPPPPAPAFSRIGGSDRYATAAAVSASTFATGVDTVFVVTGDDYPDGLTAGAIAGSLAAPVLLVRRGSIPTATATELTRLNPRRIVVVGGPAVIDAAVIVALDAFSTGVVTRISGPDRYATAAALSLAYISPGVDEVYIATGTDFADALTAAAAAGANNAPVLLTRPSNLPTATATELARLAPARITIVGGPNAIAPAIATALAPFAPTITRVYGADRYATAAAVSAHAFDRATTVHLATGERFADALAAGPVAATSPGPILLARQTCIPRPTNTEITRLAANRVVLLGGPDALTDPLPTCP